MARAARPIFDLPGDGLRVILVRDLDVPTYIDYGAADAGIAGGDVIAEQGRDRHEPVDLGSGRCRRGAAVAAPGTARRCAS